MTQPPLRVAIYARFSTDKQRDASIEDQVDSCRELAAREGWEVVATYHDRATSGASMFRPGIEALQRDAKAGRFEIVLAEAMDRLSRKLADIAKFHERMDHQGIEIHTLTEGKVDAMLIGMKGTMNQILLRDIGIKTHRGQKGRVRAGKLAGGNAYGYDVLPGISVNGKLEHGDRAVNRIEAEVVRRIFEDYAQGISAGKIAEALNLEKIPGPRGGFWGTSTILGNRERGTGILNNELYVGRLVWNRLHYSKDPDTGKRNSRQNSEDRVTSVA
nr:recombinase family protein [Paracoccus sp. (in: a-proteobacteria)]